MLLNRISSNSSNVSKDMKIDAVHGLLKQQQTLCLLGTCYAARLGGKSCMASGIINDVVSNAFCSRTANTATVSLNERMMVEQSTFFITLD